MIIVCSPVLCELQAFNSDFRVISTICSPSHAYKLWLWVDTDDSYECTVWLRFCETHLCMGLEQWINWIGLSFSNTIAHSIHFAHLIPHMTGTHTPMPEATDTGYINRKGNCASSLTDNFSNSCNSMHMYVFRRTRDLRWQGRRRIGEWTAVWGSAACFLKYAQIGLVSSVPAPPVLTRQTSLV